jgi:hypothetical protein
METNPGHVDGAHHNKLMNQKYEIFYAHPVRKEFHNSTAIITHP